MPLQEVEYMELVILIGLQAAGKSTFYQSQLASTHEVVSKDRLNSSKARNKELRQRERIEAAFAEGKSIVVDNTNITAQERQPLIELAHQYSTQVIGYYFEPDVKASRERNQQRAGKAQVPDRVIFITAHRLAPPSYDEGFDALYNVRVAEHSTPDNPQWLIEAVPRSEELKIANQLE
jgi:predicted kinase